MSPDKDQRENIVSTLIESAELHAEAILEHEVSIGENPNIAVVKFETHAYYLYLMAWIMTKHGQDLESLRDIGNYCTDRILEIHSDKEISRKLDDVLRSRLAEYRKFTDTSSKGRSELLQKMLGDLFKNNFLAARHSNFVSLENPIMIGGSIGDLASITTYAVINLVNAGMYACVLGRLCGATDDLRNLSDREYGKLVKAGVKDAKKMIKRAGKSL
ncbi:hypothetical protein OT109_06335 [Phycisphaeraceae bacterium D3-23]